MDTLATGLVPSESLIVMETPTGCLVALPPANGGDADSLVLSRRRRRGGEDESDQLAGDVVDIISRFRTIVDIRKPTASRRNEDGGLEDAVQHLICAVGKLGLRERKRSRLCGPQLGEGSPAAPDLLQEAIASLDQMRLSGAPAGDPGILPEVLAELHGLLRTEEDRCPEPGRSRLP